MDKYVELHGTFYASDTHKFSKILLREFYAYAITWTIWTYIPTTV